MNVGPLSQAKMTINLSADEADIVLIALAHTRQEYLGLKERSFISKVRHEIQKRIVTRREFVRDHEIAFAADD